MKRFIEGEDRTQVTLLPDCLDDYVAEDNPVRAVDAFVEELDLKALGFAGADPAATGRPGYHPVEAMQRRLDRKPNAMTLRRRTIEHVFGTLKYWMGSTHFLTRRLHNVGTEMSLQVLAYNFKRVIQLLGMRETMRAMRFMSA